MAYVAYRNTGLPTNFFLVDGKFNLVGGTAKVDDNMRMLVGFMGWFRLFTPDFVTNLYWLYQKDTSFINRFKSMARMKFLESAQKYAPFADVTAMDLPILPSNRREMFVDITYTYTLDKEQISRSIRLIRAL
jgi:hypothetical protein